MITVFVGTDECEYPRIIYCCEIYYELTRGTRVVSHDFWDVGSEEQKEWIGM